MHPLTVFSSPYEGDFTSRFNMLSVKLFEVIRDRVNAIVETDISGENSPCADPRDYWSSDFGTVNMLLNQRAEHDISKDWLRTQFNIACFCAGETSQISEQLISPDPISVQGRTVAAGEIRVQGAHGHLEVFEGPSTQPKYVFERRDFAEADPIWTNKSGDELIVRQGSSSFAKIIPNEWHSTWDPENMKPVSKASMSDFKSAIEGAYDLLEEHLPHYYLWTAFPMKHITSVVRPDVDTTASSSHFYNLGSIEICNPASPVEIAEIMVHECSHQFFNSAIRVGPFALEGAPEHYSILTETSRPLDRVLIGYHAFANCLIMYKALEQSGHRREVEKRISLMVHLVQNLTKPLVQEADKWLTDYGKAIFYPLHERVEGYL